MEEIIMTPQVCMQFLVWSYYYHGIMPEKDRSFATYGRFSASDAKRIDELKETLFRSFEKESVVNACRQFQLAKQRQEPCPFPQSQLDKMFAEETNTPN